MRFEEFKCELDQRNDSVSLKDNKDTNDTSQNPDAKKEEGKEKSRPFEMTPQEDLEACAMHDQCMKSRELSDGELRESQSDAEKLLCQFP